jgi:hypothetical protein
LLFGAGRGVSGFPQTGFQSAGIQEKQGISWDFGPETTEKTGKILGLQLLIRQQGKNVSCLFRASYWLWMGQKLCYPG